MIPDSTSIRPVVPAEASTPPPRYRRIVPALLGQRGSRRDLVRGMIAAGVDLTAGRRSSRAQEQKGSVLAFSSWAIVEASTRDSMADILQVFEQIYSAKIEAIGIPFAETLDQLLALERMGELPDVMQLSGSWPRVLASRGLLAGLGPLSDEAPELLMTSPVALEAGMYDGVLYALPFTVAPLGLWYSREALRQAGLNPEQPPRSIAELDEMLPTLRANMPDDAYPMRIDVTMTEYAVTRFWPWIWTFGGNPMPDDGQGNVTSINWTDEGTIAAFVWLQNVAQKGYILPPNINWQDRQLLANGKIGFMLDGPYLTSQIPILNPKFGSRELINEGFGVTTTPVLREGNAPVTVADLHQLAISAQSQNWELAARLLRFLMTNERAIQGFHIPQGGLLPVLDDNTSQEFGASYADAIGTTFLNEIEPSMRLPPYGPRYSQAAELVARAMQDVALHGDVRVEERLAQLNQEVQSVYAQEAEA